MVRIMLTELFGKCPQVKTLNFLLAHPFHKYTKKEIAQGSEISRMTLDKFIEEFLELEILIKDNGLYLINKKSYVVALMDKLQETLADMESEKQLETFSEVPAKLSDAQLNELLDVDEKNIIFDENEELILVERKELDRLQDLEKKYNNYAQKQMELTSELLKTIHSSKDCLI
jgi:hypothetical protein